MQIGCNNSEPFNFDCINIVSELPATLKITAGLT